MPRADSVATIAATSLLALASLGCGPGGVGVQTQTTSTSETDASTEASASSESTTDTEASTEASTESSDSGTDTTTEPDPDMGVLECDPWLQDCPEGEKCVPYDSDGSEWWDDNKCVEVRGDGQPGDACTYDGLVEATDDCDESSHCWHVTDVDGELIGVCAAFCQGTPEAPVCPEGTGCLGLGVFEDVVVLCTRLCDPILQDCGLEEHGCFWDYVDLEFICVWRSSDAPEGEPCGYINDCMPGLYCADAAWVPSCAGPSCCVPYCHLDDVDACPDPNQECTPLFEITEVPANDYEHVGACVSLP